MNMRTIKNWRITFMSLVALSFAACSTQKDEPLQPLDDVMMQAFYWDVIAVGTDSVPATTTVYFFCVNTHF